MNVIQYDEYGGFYDDPFDPPSGCNGRCNRDHPCITLRFDANTKSTIANLSHRLDPFVQCMNGLVEEGKAWPYSASEYQISGYLRSNVTLLRSHNGFGRHLVKVESAEIDASDAAQAAELEEQETISRAAKRPRKMEEAEDDDGLALEDVEELSRAALDIVVKHRLKIDLQDDPLTLFCVRRVSKSMKKVAESIASTKAKTLDLTVTPLINGKQRYGDYKLEGYDSETFSTDGFGPDGPEYVTEYTKLENISMSFQPSEIGGGGYEPTNVNTATFSWDSGKLDRYAEDEHDRDEDDASYSEYAYRGAKLRVYFQPKDTDPIKSPLRSGGMFGEQQPSLGFHAQFSLPRQSNIGIVSKSQRGVTINYEVLESNTSETEEVVEEEEVSEYETDEEAEDGVRRVVKIVERMGNFIQYSGRIKVIDVKVDFSVLVRLHASEVMRELNRKYGSILRERPLTTTETEYLQLVESACKR
jgi:hypothetical protein